MNAENALPKLKRNGTGTGGTDATSHKHLVKRDPEFLTNERLGKIVKQNDVNAVDIKNKYAFLLAKSVFSSPCKI